MKLIKINSKNIDLLNNIMDMIYDEWGKTFSSSKEEKLAKFKMAILAGEQFPQAYLLKENNNSIGSFLILEHELKGSDLSPWLACVVVNKEYRGKGNGKILLENIKKVIEKKSLKFI